MKVTSDICTRWNHYKVSQAESRTAGTCPHRTLCLSKISLGFSVVHCPGQMQSINTVTNHQASFRGLLSNTLLLLQPSQLQLARLQQTGSNRTMLSLLGVRSIWTSGSSTAIYSQLKHGCAEAQTESLLHTQFQQLKIEPSVYISYTGKTSGTLVKTSLCLYSIYAEP